MAKPKKWTVQSALNYLEANFKTNRGLTFWSARDYLARHNPGVLMAAMVMLAANGK